MWNDLCFALEIDMDEYLADQTQISRIKKLSDIYQQVVLVSQVFLPEIIEKMKTILTQQ